MWEALSLDWGPTPRARDVDLSGRISRMDSRQWGPQKPGNLIQMLNPRPTQEVRRARSHLFDSSVLSHPLDTSELPYMRRSLHFSPFRVGFTACFAFGALSTSSSAQQFQEDTGALSGARWTEGIEAADVDNDGDLDLFFADGDGFSAAGTKRRNRLYVNGLEIAAGTWTDESTARLGTLSSNAKQVITGDIENDGWIDALFCNGFNTDPPFLYVNQGASNPGLFTEDAANRGLTEALSSGSGMFGDLDNDGDLDLVLCDSGASFLGGAGDKSRLYLNDGSGDFTEDAANFNAPVKRAQMDIQLVDIDNDWDLDVVGFNRHSNSGTTHTLLLNDGSAVFTESSSLIDSTGSNVYEAEVGDLDGDLDIDFFYTSLSGFAEGHQENRLIPDGSLSLQNGATLSGQDDNEIGLIDYDNDGDYDIIVGSLGSREKAIRNNGSLSFTQDNSIIEQISDSTLDIAIADLDNDGDYDLVTGQGESGGFTNRIYLNGGSTDNLAPVIRAIEPLTGQPDNDGPWVVRAGVEDQVMDDRNDWLTASVEYNVLTAPQPIVDVSMVGLNFSPAGIVVPSGTTVRWTNPNMTVHTVTSTTDGYSFDSGAMGINDEFEYTFVRPGVYTYKCIPHETFGMVGTVTVTGSSTVASAVHSGVGQYRFEMTDTAAGDGAQLAYELRFTDWAGNTTVSESKLVTIVEPGFFQYGLGASPANTIVLQGSGSSSIGGAFSADASSITGAVAFFGISLAEANYPLLGGVGLIDPLALITLKIKGAGGGTASQPILIPNDITLVGLDIFFQVSSLVTVGPDVWEHSNGLKLTLGF